MSTVIVKPTCACNARCRYCSAAHSGFSRRMDMETVRGMFRLFSDWARIAGERSLCFIWHGGEPLLMPLRFWEDILGMEQEAFGRQGIAVLNRIQSNLTRLEPEGVAILKKLLGPRGVVGTSADPIPGVRELNGSPDGEYEKRWVNATALLRDHGLRYGILYVVHRLSLSRLGEIYRCLRQEHPDSGLRFNPLYRQGRAREKATWDDMGITAEEWGEALARLYELWTRDGRPMNVQPFGPWWELYARGKWRLSCESSGTCVRDHFGVDPGGTVTLCGRSADGGELSFGRVPELDAEMLRSHPLRRALANRATYLRRTFCRDCPWWLYCHGGCTSDSILAHGTPFAPTSFCSGLRRFFDRAFADRSGKEKRCVA